MTEDNKNFIEKLQLKYITPIIAIAAAIHSFWFTVQKSELETKSMAIENKYKTIQSELLQIEFQNEIKMNLYKEVKEAINADSNIQKATLLAISEFFKNDSSGFGIKLQNILLGSAKSTTGAQNSRLMILQSQIDTTSIEASAKGIKEDQFRIDVFYLEDILVESKPRAEKIVEKIRAHYPKYDVRLRLLPKIINSGKSYRIDRNQIRCEQEEFDKANEINKLITTSKIFENEQIVINPIKYKTPSYISVFVRNR